MGENVLRALLEYVSVMIKFEVRYKITERQKVLQGGALVGYVLMSLNLIILN